MLLDSKPKPSKKSQYDQPNELVSIPPMASAISKRISNLRQGYNKLVDEARLFFAEYETQNASRNKLKKSINAYQEQIDLLENYRKKNGKLPKIKDQPSSKDYLYRLYRLQSKAFNQIKTIEQNLTHSRIQRHDNLERLVNQLLELLDGQRIFSQFLGTIALSVPSPDEKVKKIRQTQNTKNKPIYTTALTLALFEEVRLQNIENQIHPYLTQKLSQIFNLEDNYSLMIDKSEQAEHSERYNRQPMPDNIKSMYREEILKPLAKAALLQSIGSHSPEADQIFNEDRYRKLTQTERDKLLEVIHLKTIRYIESGIGIPTHHADKQENAEQFIASETEKLQFILEMQHKLMQPQDKLGDLLRIPMIYTSIILSTKPEFEFTQIYKAYDLIEKRANEQLYHLAYANLFNNMVGRFPLGSGIYFIQEDTGEIERAIVSSLYPEHPDEPICKQITRRQLQFINQTEVIISKVSNLYFNATRQASHYKKQYLADRLSNQYVWNASELWEVQVHSIDFWKKDNTQKYNNQYQSFDSTNHQFD